MARHYLKLQPSESVVFEAASRIFAAYVASGKVAEDSKQHYIEESVDTAIQIAKRTDKLILSEDEPG